MAVGLAGVETLLWLVATVDAEADTSALVELEASACDSDFAMLVAARALVDEATASANPIEMSSESASVFPSASR